MLDFIRKAPIWFFTAILICNLALIIYLLLSGHTFKVSDTINLAIDKNEASSTNLNGVATKGIEVLSNNHSSGANGVYFNFKAEFLDTLVGHQQWDDTLFVVLQPRTGKIGTARVWRAANGGSVGNAHGRWNPRNTTPEQWLVGDVALFFVQDPVNPVND